MHLGLFCDVGIRINIKCSFFGGCVWNEGNEQLSVVLGNKWFFLF